MRFVILLIIIILLLFVYGSFRLSGEISRKEEEQMKARRYNISDKAFNTYFSAKVKCSHCGHSFPLGNSERAICNHCGNWVYKNKKIEFKYELQKRIKNTN